MNPLNELTQARIALLVAGYVDTRLLGQHGDLPTMYKKFFYTNVPDVAWQIESFNVYQGHFPTANEFDAFVITGSRYSVNDDLNWIRQLEDFSRTQIADGLPIIGFCFGHQLLAKALGGTVEKYEFGANVGLSRVNIVSKPAWLAGLYVHPSLVVLANHAEQITHLPKDAEIIAASDECPIQIFQKGNNVLGFQFHPEYEIDYQEALMARNTGLEPKQLLDARRRNATLSRNDRQIARWIKQFISKSIS